MRTSISKRFCCLPVLCVLAFAPVPARAAEPTPTELSVARRLFEEGKEAADAGLWREAASKFRQATAIKDTPGIRFHLARCEEQQGALVEALVEYDRARELLDHGAKAPDVEKLLPDAREKVKARLGQLVVRLPEGVADVSVELDGKAVLPSVLGLPLPVNPGPHRLRAQAPGREAFVSDLTLTAGEAKEISIELAPAARATTAAVSEPPASPSAGARRGDESPVSGRTIALVGEGSLFVAALTTGIVFTIKRSAASDRYDAANRLILAQLDDPMAVDSACRAQLDGCEQLVEAEDDRAEAGTVATIAFVAAGASAAAFGLTYWLWPTESAPVELKAGAAPGGLALSVSGRF